MDKNTVFEIYKLLKEENENRKEEIYKYIREKNCSIYILKEMELKNYGIRIARDIIQDKYNEMCVKKVEEA